jgi:tetratricopeptide (TPR) repeat protein
LVLLPLLVLGLAEGGLRLLGLGYATTFFKKSRIQDDEVFVENDTFGLRFVAPELARTPPPVVMNAAKRPGSYRIFLLGESAALGDPRPAYGMGRYLEVLLRERFPATEFEVVCVAMTAINSHAILPIARECARHEGDLWVIYMGNNEMVGPFGAATVFGRQVPSLTSIRLTLALKRTRVGQLIDAWIGKWAVKPSGPWGGMRMFIEQTVAADDPRRQVAHGHFKRNLDDILNEAEKAGCPVVLSTVASNLRDCAPFASVHSAAMTPAVQAQFEALCRDAATNEMAGELGEALTNYSRAKALDSKFAELDFRIGQCHLRLTNNAEAQKAFTQARDADALPFRADSTLNGLIREAAARHPGRNLKLVAADEALERQAADGVPGAEFFYEHVHFNFTGNYRLARILAEAIAPQLPSSVTQSQATEWAAQETCDRQLGLTAWNRIGVLEDVLRRLQVAPFTQQANHQAQLKLWQAELKTLRAGLTPALAAAARALYGEVLPRAPRDHRLHEGYAEFLEATGSLEQAAGQWQIICDLLPHHFAAYVHAGRLLGRQKQWSAAEKHLHTALALEPRSSEGHLELGRVLADRGNLDEAIDQYQEAIRFQPGNAWAYFHLANALAQKDARSAAMTALSKAVQIRPSFWEARYLLGVELAMSNRIAEARKEFEEVLRWRPDHVLAHINLGVALVKEGRLPEAQAQFEEALRLDPKNERARHHLTTLEQLQSTLKSVPNRP